MFLKYKAKSSLRKLLKEGKHIVKELEKSDQTDWELINHWHSRCKLVIETYFDSKHFLQRNIKLKIGMLVVVLGEDEPDRPYDKKNYIDGVRKVLKTLEDGITEIKAHGLQKLSVQEHIYYVKILLSIVAGLIMYVLGLFTPEIRNLIMVDAEQKNFEQKQMFRAQILVTDLRSWYEGNNREFISEFENLGQDQSRRGIFDSPIAIGEVVKFAKTFKFSRSNTIDSFFVRLQALNVDTDTLRIVKKLPIKLDEVLKGRISRLDLDQVFIRSLRLDLL